MNRLALEAVERSLKEHEQLHAGSQYPFCEGYGCLDMRPLFDEVHRLRAALLHRCVVAAVDPACKDCRVIIDVLGPASDRR